jgi:hypothetical protein
VKDRDGGDIVLTKMRLYIIFGWREYITKEVLLVIQLGQGKKHHLFNLRIKSSLHHYLRNEFCRASRDLLCGLFRAHGKEFLCCAFSIGYTTNSLFALHPILAHSKQRVCHALFGMQGNTHEFAVGFLFVHGKLFFSSVH